MRSFLGLLVLALASFVGRSDDATREFPPATVLAGKPKDRGRAYGKEFRAAIRDFLDTEIYAAFVGRPSSKDDLLRYAAACGAVVRAECPMVAAEAEGIADGAGLTFDEIVLICLHEELYHRTPLPKHGHCTAVAVGPAATGDGHAYVGQTWDWMASVAGKSRVTTWKRTDAASVLAYGFPGMPVGAGVNSEGIALCWTSAALGDKNQSPRVGVPSYMLIAHLLAQKDLAAVARAAEKDKHAGWFTFVMADGKGNLLNLEGSPTGIAVERPTDKLARVDFGTARMLGTGKIHARCRTMYDLLDGTKGKNDLARLKDYFADAKYQINVGKGTIDQMVFDTTARKAHLSRGTSYKLAWREFAFD